MDKKDISTSRIIDLSKTLKDEYIKDYKKLSSKYSGQEKSFFETFFDPKKRFDSEVEVLNTFLSFVKDRTMVNRFRQLIHNLDDKEKYERFLASVMIYIRIDSFVHSFDKFLYLCIAVEAAMNYGIKGNKKKSQLFRDFFVDNLSEESKLKIISNFQDTSVEYVCDGTSLQEYHHARSEGKNIKIKKIKRPTQVPLCYKRKQCYLAYGRCCPEILCAIKGNSKQIDSRLYFVLDYLYGKRSDFVHEGKSFAHPESQPEKHYTDIGINDLYENPMDSSLQEIFYSLDIKDLFFLYEEALYKNFC